MRRQANRCDAESDKSVEGDGGCCQASKGRSTLVGQNASYQANFQESGHHIEDLHHHSGLTRQQQAVFLYWLCTGDI